MFFEPEQYKKMSWYIYGIGVLLTSYPFYLAR